MNDGTHAKTQEIYSHEWNHANDPSAGSPTETLLRLLLPLNDKVYTVSGTSSKAWELSTSKIFTGSFNR